jgi:hypothetical protein
MLRSRSAVFAALCHTGILQQSALREAEMNNRRWTLRAGFATLALALWLVPVASVSATPPGFDLFETDPQSTQFVFQSPDTAIPAGFFGPGSDPFTGQVHFGGVPLETFEGKGVGDADTIVHRLSPAESVPAAIVPIELVQLSLQSIEPITITYNGGQKAEQWNVSANPSPSRPSRGAIIIHQGGTFDSQLQVIPLLTFTRLSDGSQRSLDMAPLPFESLDKLIFQQHNAPWQPGCVLPALAVPGLNDSFCPGLTPDGRKQLTLEQALLASHGVYPAQPALEHFECYTLERAPFKTRKVQLSDQFGTRTAKVTKRAELCNPAQKNSEPFVNTRAHLQCYRTQGPALNRLVAVQNQFGSQRLRVGSPRRLCLPSQKRFVLRRKTAGFQRIQVPIDHFQCYAVTQQTQLSAVQPIGSVTLKDQFGRRTAQPAKPFQLCAPVQKTLRGKVTPLQHPVRHLLCYRIKPKKVERQVQIRNQFEIRTLRTRKSVSLCVPSNKLVLSQ